MKLKKIISILIMLVIIGNTILPISFAAYIFDEDKTEYTVNASDLEGGSVNSYYVGNNEVEYSGVIYDKLETLDAKVKKTGIYEISVEMAGGVHPNYLVVKKDANGKVSVAPIATYINEDDIWETMDRNSFETKTVSIYLEEGEEFSICLIGDDGGAFAFSPPSESNSVRVSVDYIEPGANKQIYETDLSSKGYTASKCSDYVVTSDSQKIHLDELQKNESLPGLTTKQEEYAKVQTEQIQQTMNEMAETSADRQSSALEAILSWFVCGLGDSIRKAVNYALGGNISIDSLVFNEYANTRLAFFNSSRADESNRNNYLEGSGLLDSGGKLGTISKYFILFRNIAIVFYVAILLYLGVRVLLQSTGKNKEKYKSMLVDWVKGIIILALFPYAMKYCIMINDGIVSYAAGLRNELNLSELPALTEGLSIEESVALGVVNSGYGASGNLMDTMRAYALNTGRLAYAMLYLFLIKQLIGFILIYFKRLIGVLFLIVIFPLVTISYAVDKIADGKANAFNNWFKEFNMNVFLQAFQAVNYLIVMGIIFGLTATRGTQNIILTLIALEYLSKGDELLRGMFSKVSGAKAGTLPKNLKEAVKTIATVKIGKDLLGKVGKLFGRVKNVGVATSKVSNAYYTFLEAREKEKDSKKLANEVAWMNNPNNPENMAIENVFDNIKTALNQKGNLLGADLRLLEAKTPEEVVNALSQILKIQMDPNKKALFEREYNNLSPKAREQLDMMLGGLKAITDTLNNNVGTNGALTNREININAAIIADIYEGKNRGPYKDLYKYFFEDSDSVVVNAEGKQLGDVASVLMRATRGRVLNEKEQKSFEKVQNMLGTTDLCADLKVRENSVISRARAVEDRRLYSMNQDERTALNGKSQVMMQRYNVSGANAEKGAHILVTYREYQTRIRDGLQDGMQASEALELSTELKYIYDEAKKSGDTELVKMIDDSEKFLGFNVEQMVTLSAVNVINNYQLLEGTETEKQEQYDLAIETVQKRHEEQLGRTFHGRNREEARDNTVLAILYRSEIDDVLNGEVQKGTRRLKTKDTLEDIRDKKEILRMKELIEQNMDEETRMTSKEAGVELLKSLGGVVGAVGSVATIPVNIAAGATTTALFKGAAASDNILQDMVAANMGMSLEDSIEGLIPGTAAAQDKKTLGHKISEATSKAAHNKFGLTEAEKHKEISDRIQKNESARARIDSYKQYIKKK